MNLQYETVLAKTPDTDSVYSSKDLESGAVEYSSLWIEAGN